MARSKTNGGTSALVIEGCSHNIKRIPANKTAPGWSKYQETYISELGGILKLSSSWKKYAQTTTLKRNPSTFPVTESNHLVNPYTRTHNSTVSPIILKQSQISIKDSSTYQYSGKDAKSRETKT